MKPPSYSDAQLVPLSTDALVQQRVRDLIGRAIRRQLWLLFLDADDVQLPLLIQIDDLPPAPTAEGREMLAHRFGDIAEATDARAMILVLERYGSDSLSESDRAWARNLHEAADLAGVTLRALLLSHRSGVRWIAQDDYRY